MNLKPLLIAGAALLFAAPSAHAQKRIALVIGNNDYTTEGKLSRLKNCVLDARLMRKTLETVGFEVTIGENLTRGGLDDLLLNFEKAIMKGDVAVFYFAGHGIEVEGSNYLLGTNAQMKARSRLGEESIKAETIAAAMLQSGASSSILLLDCCRDAPEDSQWLSRSGFRKRGLAEIHIDGDIVIGFAATPGKAALEPNQEGSNSPYATALARWIPSGLDHTAMFQKVRQEVHELTDGEQRTWESGSLLKPFVFHPSNRTGDTDGSLPPATVEMHGKPSLPGLSAADTYSDEMRAKLTTLSGELEQSPLDQAALLKLVGLNELIKDDPKLKNLAPIADSLVKQALARRGAVMKSSERGQEISPPQTAMESHSAGGSSGGQSYRIVYTGSDGVNMRDAPGGTLLSTTYDQNVALFTQVPGSSQKYVNGVPWIEGTLEGWMAIRKDTRSFDYSQHVGNGIYRVTWDGGGDPNDAFISLRSSSSTRSTLLAKVYRGAPFQILSSNRVSSGGYQWVKARIGGWMAEKSPKGTTMLRNW